MRPSLSYQGEADPVFLDDGSYRWVITKRFTSDSLADSTAEEVLAELLEQPAYRYGYDSPERVDEAPIHGPYRLDALSPSVFDYVTATRSEQVLREWMDQFVGQNGALDESHVLGDISAVFDLIRNADACYRLANLGPDAWRPMGGIVGKFGFHEFVLLGPGTRVTVVVAGDD